MITQSGLARSARHPASAFFLFFSVAVGFFMAALDSTVVNVASATMGRELGLGTAGLTWVIDGFMLAFASLLLLAGGIGVRFGPRLVYLLGLGLFIASSLACALAPSGGALVEARIVQGAASALFLPSSLVLLVSAFPDRGQRARMVALWSAAGAAASGLGPVIGGILVQEWGWRSIFYVNVPIGAAGLLLTAWLIRPISARGSSPLKIFDHALIAAALFGLMYALIEGPGRGWSDLGILACVAAMAACGTGFVLRECRSHAPVFPTELLADRTFSVTNAVGFLLNFGLYGVLFMMSLFLQQERGDTAAQAGFQLLPMMAVFVVGNLLVARVITKTGTRWPMLIGLLAGAAGSMAMLTLSPGTPYWLLVTALSVANLGLGITAPAMNAALMEAAGSYHAAVGGATLNTTRQIGTLLGVAVAGTVLASFGHWYSAARTVLGIGGAAYLLAAVLILCFFPAATQRTSA